MRTSTENRFDNPLAILIMAYHNIFCFCLLIQASLCLDLFSLLIESADLDAEPSLSQLAAQLYHLARKHNQWDADYAVSDIFVFISR